MIRELYICCDEKDASSEERLRSGLLPILSRFDLVLWSRRDLTPGSTWKDEMKKHLALSSFFVALVSSDCLADDICNVEMKAALYREYYEELKIIPIILRPCMFEFSDLARFPSLPKNGKAISEQNIDSTWTNVLRDLIEMISASHRYLRERS